MPQLIKPLTSPQTRVLVIMNGLIEDDLLEMLRGEQLECKCVYGGMALICSNRLSPGVIDHSSYKRHTKLTINAQTLPFHSFGFCFTILFGRLPIGFPTLRNAT